MSRLFVAVWPSAEVVSMLAGLSRVERPGVRWLGAEHWHVTLRFLGEADEALAMSRLDDLVAAPCEARFSGPVGRLGRSALVVPVAGLEELAAAVGAAMVGVGDQPERPWLGHLTLARLKNVPACSLVEDAVVGRWPVDRVALVRSELSSSGARYHTLREVPLCFG